MTVKKDKKIVGFDFIRSFAIFFVFIAHMQGGENQAEIETFDQLRTGKF